MKRPIYGIWAMQKNKDPSKFLKNFKGIFKKIITMTIDSEPNACSAEHLKQIVAERISAISKNSRRVKKLKSKQIKQFVLL